MGTEGLEPSHPEVHNPKSCASANSATSPHRFEVYQVDQVRVKNSCIGIGVFSAETNPLNHPSMCISLRQNISQILTELPFCDNTKMTRRHNSIRIDKQTARKDTMHPVFGSDPTILI